MKKIISVLLTIFVFSSVFSCFADTVSTEGGSVDHGVFAKYIRSSKSALIETKIKDNEYNVSTDSAQIKVVPRIPDNSLSLVVHAVSSDDTAAFSWFTNCTKSFGSEIFPYEICYLDSQNKRIELTENTDISLSLPSENDNPSVYSLKRDGTASKIESEIKGGTITFSMVNTDYIVLVANSAAPAIKYGDVNKDNSVSASDALLVLQTTVKMISLDPDEALLADVDGNSQVNSLDSLLILKYSVDKITSFPVQIK